MLLKLYNLEHTLIGGLKNHKDAKVESELSTGDKTLSFLWHSRNKLKVSNEYYIRTDTDEFVIKENAKGSKGYRKIVAKLNLEDIEAKVWKTFTATECTAQQMADLALADTGWTCVSTVPVTKLRNITLVKVNSYQVFEKIQAAFICEVQWDTLNKIVYLKEQVGEERGAYFISGLNLKELSDTSDTYDFATEIIPFGADDLDITSVNNGSNYLSNYQYSKKKIAVIWEDSNYTDPQALMEDAQYYLNEISKPKKVQQAKLVDLAKLKPGYKALAYSVGDTITLIDDETEIWEKQRITRTVEYLESPEKNTCDISNTVLSFEEMQKKLFDAADCVSNITTGNGIIKGSSVDKIDISQIIGIEEYLSGDLNDLKADYIYARKELGAIYAAIGEADFTTANTNNLTVNTRADIELAYITESYTANAYGDYAKFTVVEADNIAALEARIDKITSTEITVEYLEANYAQIAFANVDVESVQDLFVNVGLIKDATIVEGKITGYLDAVTINAESIKAGTLSVDRLVLNGTKESLIYALNNAGELTSTHCDTLDGGLITERTITTDHIITGAITANEIASGAITADKIDVANVTAEVAKVIKLDAGQITSGYIDASRIRADSITADKIASKAITANEIASGAITADKIASKAITADKIDVNNLFAQSITATGSITGARLYGTHIEAVSGKIGQFSLSGDTLNNTSGDYSVTLRSVRSDVSLGVFFITDKTSGTATYPFRVNGDGSFSATKATLTGNIKANSIIITGALKMVCSSYNETASPVIKRYQKGSTVETEICGHNGEIMMSHNSEGAGIVVPAYLQAKSSIEASANIYTGKRASGIGNQGVAITSYGAIQLSRAASGGNPYIGLYYDNATSAVYWSGIGKTCSNLSGYVNINSETAQSTYRLFVNGNMCTSGLVSKGVIRPQTDSTSTSTGYFLGHSSYKWRTVYAYNSAINTSDRNEKHNIKYEFSEALKKIFYELKPVSYIMNGGKRTHFGIIAQDAEETINKYGYTIDDLAFLCRDQQCVIDGDEVTYLCSADGSPKYIYGVRYTELIPMTLWQTQEHEIRLNNQELEFDRLWEKIKSLEVENEILKEKIAALAA